MDSYDLPGVEWEDLWSTVVRVVAELSVYVSLHGLVRLGTGSCGPWVELQEYEPVLPLEQR